MSHSLPLETTPAHASDPRHDDGLLVEAVDGRPRVTLQLSGDEVSSEDLSHTAETLLIGGGSLDSGAGLLGRRLHAEGGLTHAESSTQEIDATTDVMMVAKAELSNSLEENLLSLNETKDEDTGVVVSQPEREVHQQSDQAVQLMAPVEEKDSKVLKADGLIESGSTDASKAPKRVPTLIPNIDDFEMGQGVVPQHSNHVDDFQPADAVQGTEADLGATDPKISLSAAPEGNRLRGGEVVSPEDGIPRAAADPSSTLSGGHANEAGTPSPLDKDKSPVAAPDSLEDERRINLASSDDGAVIIASNKEAKYADRAIDADADSFVKNICSANKWLLIELSQVSE